MTCPSKHESVEEDDKLCCNIYDQGLSAIVVDLGVGLEDVEVEAWSQKATVPSPARPVRDQQTSTCKSPWEQKKFKKGLGLCESQRVK